MIDSTTNKRIAKNTLLLYFRQILIMLVSLYTVRIVLSILGVEDYGIYNVVAGIVSMFGFLSGSMAIASQRFFSFELGRKDYERLQKTFSISIEIYALIAITIILAAETIGLWFVKNKLVIPADRMNAALWIYQLSILSFILSIITTPYMAVIIARENMDIYAYISIIEAALKLGSVFLLKVFIVDKLKLYGMLLFLVMFINSVLYVLVCRKRYPESHFRFLWDISMFRTLFSFSVWNLFGSSVGVVKNQAINILLNMHFGPVVNAARGIASQVNSAVTSFAQSFSTAVRPQIIKQFAASKKEEMMSLVFQSSKATAYLMFFFVLPLVFEMPLVINLWLGQIPEFVVLFTRLVLIDALIDSISYPLMTAAQATGKIKLYQSVVGGVLLLNLPVSYIALKLKAPAESVMIIAIIITAIAFVIRLVIIKKLLEFSIIQYFKKVVVPVLLVIFLSSLVLFIFNRSLNQGLLRLFLSIILSIISIAGFIILFGLTNEERKYLAKYFKKIIR